MSENLHQSPEHTQNHHETAAEAEKRSKELLENSRQEAARAEGANNNKLREIREQINTHAESKDTRQEKTGDEEPESANAYWFSQEYRSVAYKQILNRTQQHLTKSQKALSKLVHQPTVEKLSDIGGKTVARPSGVLIGSIFSFVSSLAVYAIAKRNGYDMTYSIIMISFLGGFIVGVAVEFAYRAFKSLLARD